MVGEQAKDAPPEGSSGWPAFKHLTQELAHVIDGLLEGISMRSGFGSVQVTMTHHKVREAEDRATYRLSA